MSFSFSGGGKTKSEAQASLVDGWKQAQPYAPASALAAGLAALERVGEPPAGKALSISLSGHAVSPGESGGYDSLSLTASANVDLPVETPAPQVVAETAPAETAVDLPGTPASS